MIRLLHLLLFTVISTLAAAQNHQELALQAYLSAELAGWDDAIEAAQQLPDERDRHIYGMRYNQLALGAAMGLADEKASDRYIDQLDAAVDAYWELDEKNAAAHGHYSALLGFKIARNPMSGMLYGSKASKYAKTAYEMDPSDPVAALSITSNLFYTPKQWGGDPDKALGYITKAAAALPTGWESDPLALDVLVTQGMILAALERKEEAKAVYERILTAQPEHSYVRHKLLPALESGK